MYFGDDGNVTMNNTEHVRRVFVKLNENVPDTDDPGLYRVLKGMGPLFYAVDSEETSYQTVQEVPDFIQKAIPYFILFMVIENLLLWIEKKPRMRINDGVTSMSLGLIQQCGRLLFRGAESYAYIYIYENFRLFELPWDNPYTWYAAAIGIDFCYYWLHRASHEIHIFWAQHQVHHSSEEYHLGVALRQSLFQGWCGFVFYLPLALCIPPSHFITHHQFNTLFQFWIHTKAISHLGPFEYILNTPRHHRVHHGSNLYCLDKNYGGVLIIWDRIFGTFAAERKDEEIIYGLVFNQPSFNPVHLQTFYSIYVFKKFGEMQGWKNKFFAVFYGPSWSPGKPRLGIEAEKPRVGPRKKYDVELPLWCNIYLLTHFAVTIYGFHELAGRYMGLGAITVLAVVVYIIASLTIIGMLFDGKPHANVFELMRCVLSMTALQRLDFSEFNPNVILGLQVFFVISSGFWLMKCLNILEVSRMKKEK